MFKSLCGYCARAVLRDILVSWEWRRKPDTRMSIQYPASLALSCWLAGNEVVSVDYAKSDTLISTLWHISLPQLCCLAGKGEASISYDVKHCYLKFGGISTAGDSWSVDKKLQACWLLKQNDHILWDREITNALSPCIDYGWSRG